MSIGRWILAMWIVAMPLIAFAVGAIYAYCKRRYGTVPEDMVPPWIVAIFWPLLPIALILTACVCLPGWGAQLVDWAAERPNRRREAAMAAWQEVEAKRLREEEEDRKAVADAPFRKYRKRKLDTRK